MVRLLSGVALAAVFLTLVWFASANVLLIVAIAVVTLAAHEYIQLMRQLGAQVPAIPTIAITWAALASVPFRTAGAPAGAAPSPGYWIPHVAPEIVLTIGLMVIAIRVMTRQEPASGAANAAPPPQADTPSAALDRGLSRAGFDVAAAMLAPVYLGLPLGALVGIHVFGSRGAVLLLMVTIVVSDSAQFYAGRTFGRHPLAPRLSPKKTIEGAIGGFIMAPVFLIFAAPYLLAPATNRLALVGVGLALVVAGIAGDLFESTLKRAAGVKDSSALIPGHGGVLDRIDALLFASPIFYVYVRWVYSL